MTKVDNRLKCSFCGKSQDQVKKLISGPGVYICTECIDLCNEIVDEDLNTAFKEAIASGKPPSSPNVWSSSLMELQAMSLDDWRGKKIDDSDHTHKQLVKNACDALEALVEYYRAEALRGGLEPFYRALLCLKEKSLGNSSEELVPLLSEMAHFYSEKREYKLAASLLEWLIEIAHLTGAVDETESKVFVIKLIKLYIRLGKDNDAEVLLDSLYKFRQEEKSEEKPSEVEM